MCDEKISKNTEFFRHKNYAMKNYNYGETMSTIAKINHSTRKTLGSVGRPVAVATGVGFGSYYAGQKFDVGFLQDGYNCAGVGVLAAIGTELALDHFGDTTALEAADAAAFVKSKEANSLTLEDLKAAGMDDASAQQFLTVANLAQPTPQQPAQQKQQPKPRVAAS